MPPILTAFATSPDRGQGLARDMRVRWALEELAVEVRDAFDGVDLEQAREDVRNAVEELAGISIVEQV